MKLLEFLTGVMLCGAIVILSACNVLQTRSQAPAPVVESPRLDEENFITILRYSRYISALSNVRLVDEYRKLDNANRIEPTLQGQLKLAILLSRNSTEIQDNNRAIRMLREIAGTKDRSVAALTGYAYMLLDSLRIHTQSNKKLAEMSKKLNEERQKRRQLEQKLEALKSIEKTISDRQNEAKDVN